MHICSLTVENFKNAEQETIRFSEGINVIYGSNASGKTNLLEAIFFFASSRSFRGCKEKDLIQFGKTFAKAELVFVSNELERSINLLLQKNERRQIFVNRMRVQKVAEYLGLFRAVVFTPDHLNLVKGSSPFRRKFLDIAICQSFPRYVSSLHEYQRLTEQKTALLKTERPDRALLEIYHERMAPLAAIITLNRNRYIRTLEESAAAFQAEMSGEKEKLELRYLSQSGEATASLEELKTAYLNIFREKAEKEIQYGLPLYGPQKDDFEVLINGKNARTFGSQGQQRSAVLSLKLAEGELSQRLTGDYPVFLLDDILSELDDGRRKYILSKIPGKQVILTGCEPELFSEYRDANRIFVSEGKAVNV